MTDRLPVFDDTEHRWLKAAAREWNTVEEHVADVLHRHHQTPAQQPVNLAPERAATQGDTMSLITDVEDGYAAVKNELAKFEQALPGALAKAKQFEGSPFAVLAEKVASGILPPEAVSIAVGAADKVLDDLIGLYAPAQAAQPPAAQ